MCSIMGYCGPVVDLDKFKEGFQRTISRGPDDSRIVDTGNGLLGFHRLAIMGLTPSGMQPFQLDGSYVVCNGEIYGFEKIKEELSDRYSFASDSDCEILLPLYKEYGTDMFAMLDAEFACILYDGDTGEYIAARDPIGIRPLYYGYDEKGVILFASEAKNLVGLTDKIMPFPPGYYYKNGSFTCYCDITKSEHICRDDLETVCRNIYDLLIEGVKKRLVADAKVGFLLSGGLDSSLVCAIAAKESRKPIRTFAIGMREDAIDLKYAKQTAEYIGSEHTEIYMTPEEVIDTLEEVIHVLGTYDITTIRASVGMYLVCRAIHEQTDIRVLLTGEISDELFGYKYTDFAPGPEAFQEESVKRIRELHMYDVYVSLTKEYEQKYTYEQAIEIVKKALAVLGDDYVALLDKGFSERWVDVYENEGKKSGAYSWGSYDSHPYVLMSFNGNIDSVFTLAHEMGHSLHSWYSNHTQPFTYAEYRLFVAEVASTCNEALLIRYLLKHAKEKEEKIFLLNYFLDQFKGTVFRQTMFAEFEKRIHEKMAEEGTLTADGISELYLSINKEYFGPDMISDPQIALEWARIPHFYTPFYVYQYATGFSAAIAISSKILAGEPGIVEKYKQFLSGGCSMDPIDLLKIGGVDMTKREPVEEALDVFASYVEELEKLTAEA